MTALSVTSHVLLMTNIPADQPLGGGWTGVVFWSKLNTRRIVSSALNMGYMLPKFHGHIQVVEPERSRRLDGLVNIGIDETSYKKGHK